MTGRPEHKEPLGQAEQVYQPSGHSRCIVVRKSISELHFTENTPQCHWWGKTNTYLFILALKCSEKQKRLFIC